MTKKRRRRSSEAENMIDKLFKVLEGGGKLTASYVDSRYKIGKHVDEIKEETAERVEKVKSDATHLAYATKRGFIRTLIEAFFLITGLYALIFGLIGYFSKYVGKDVLMIGYGITVCLVILLTIKTRE